MLLSDGWNTEQEARNKEEGRKAEDLCIFPFFPVPCSMFPVPIAMGDTETRPPPEERPTMSQRDEEDPGMGFKVTDRRLFDERGELREEALRPAPQPRPESTPQPDPPADRQAPPLSDVPEGFPSGSGQGVEFSSFLMSLATSALVALGEIPDPETGRMFKHLGAARETIEILGMLEEKTRGNLTADESRMLREILYDLRMKYVSLAKAAGR